MDPLQILGEAKPIGADSSRDDVTKLINIQRSALIDVAGDQARANERIEAMGRELQERLRSIEARSRVEWVPGGSISDTIERYRADDGGFLLGRAEVEVTLPGQSKPMRIVREGLLTDPRPVSRAQAELRRAYTSYALVANFARSRGTKEANLAHPLVARAFVTFRTVAQSMPGELGEFFRAAFDKAFSRTTNGAAGLGLELLQVPTINSIRTPFDLARRLVGLIPQMDAPAESFKPPVVTGRAISRRRGKTPTDPVKHRLSQFSTSDVTISVVPRVVQGVLDPMWANSIANIMADPAGFVSDWLMSGDADTMEIAFLHGDTASTHQDALASWTMGGMYVAGDLDGDDSMNKMFLGVRAKAFDNSATISGGGTFDAADHFAALDAMGSLGNGAVMGVGLNTFYTQLLANSLFTTVDKYGPAATLLTGELGRVGNTPVVLTDFLKKEYASTGLFTGSGTTNTAVYFQPNAWAHYILRSVGNAWDTEREEMGARFIGFEEASVITTTCLSTEKPSAVIINL